MISKRKDHKLRKMEVMKVIKQINKYTKDFTYRYSNGYFVFPFGKGNFNLHLKFNKLPLMKFAIWKYDKWYYFAECIPYIDKFKPGRCEFEWDSFENMMDNILKWINNPKQYVFDLECSYQTDFSTILKDAEEDKYRNSHNGFDPEEYSTKLRAFNELVKSLDTNKIDFFWTKSDGFKNLYDVRYFVDDSVTDEWINDFERQLRDCNCFSFQWRPLPPHFYKHTKQYKYKIHPGNYSIYFNQKKHLKLFNRPDKS